MGTRREVSFTWGKRNLKFPHTYTRTQRDRETHTQREREREKEREGGDDTWKEAVKGRHNNGLLR